MSFLLSFGLALPTRVVDNEELSALTGRNPDWIRNVSGIEERRWVDPDVSVVDLATEAARRCLERGKIAPSELGLLLVSSGTAERQFPGPASIVAARLGLTETPAIDLPVASAGGLIGMSLAADLARTHGPVLIVAAEVMSRVVQRSIGEPGISVLFGDGAGACVIHPSRGIARILGKRLGTDGNFAEDLRLEHGGALAMNGKAVILQASRKLPRVISQVLEANSLRPDQIAHYLLHQANQNLMDRVADALSVDRSRFFSNIRLYGNTSSASLLIAAAEWACQSALESGAKVCFGAFGAGFHWGAMLAEGV